MGKKSAGIMTFHASYNSGSMLQAHALQKYLKDTFQIDNEIIDFSNKAQKRMYALFVIPQNIKHFLKNIVYIFFLPILVRYQNDYKKFLNKYFNLSKESYTELDEMKNQQMKYDYLISGSDQVWNVNALDFDDAYFLPFGSGTKIAYAVSLGAFDYCEFDVDNQEKYRKMTNALDHVSVRENNAKLCLEKLCQNQFEICADPTLLLDKEYWLTLEPERVVKGKYIFWYAMTYGADHLEQIKRISKKYNLPVYVFDTKEWIRRGLAFHNIKLAKASGPCSLISLINNAEIVITSSLHGTIFSTLLEKTFWYYQTSQHNEKDDRATFLLAQLAQSDRLLNTDQLAETDLLRAPDYTATKENIKDLRRQSYTFLEKALT